MQFLDRRAAGDELGRAVAEFEPGDPIVFALPRGGVPVGFGVATALHCELDLLIVRKVGLPSQPELAMGAIAEGGVVVRNEDVIELVGVDDAVFDSVVGKERVELERRVDAYRPTAEALDPAGKTAIVVDDGLATGATVEAGIAALWEKGAGSVWVAVPVAPRDTAARIEQKVDRLVVLSTPRFFQAVGAWYRDFTQTRDDEVKSLLAESRLR